MFTTDVVHYIRYLESDKYGSPGSCLDLILLKDRKLLYSNNGRISGPME